MLKQEELFRKNSGYFNRVLMELFYQFLNRVKLQFGTGTTDKRYPHRLIIDIFIKMENMHLNATISTII